MVTPEQCRAIATIMDRLPPETRKRVQIDILSGMDEKKAIMKALAASGGATRG